MTDKPNAVEEIMARAAARRLRGNHEIEGFWKLHVFEMRAVLAALDAAGYEIRPKIPVEGKVS